MKNHSPEHFENSSLLKIEPATNGVDAAKHPVALADVFARVGGDNDTQKGDYRSVDIIVDVQRDDVILENLWLWRADHDLHGQVTHNNNWVNTGLRVLGNNVVAYGLAVEHTMGSGFGERNGAFAKFDVLVLVVSWKKSRTEM